MGIGGKNDDGIDVGSLGETGRSARTQTRSARDDPDQGLAPGGRDVHRQRVFQTDRRGSTEDSSSRSRRSVRGVWQMILLDSDHLTVLDLKAASIALVFDALLLTANRRD